MYSTEERFWFCLLWRQLYLLLCFLWSEDTEKEKIPVPADVPAVLPLPYVMVQRKNSERKLNPSE